MTKTIDHIDKKIIQMLSEDATQSYQKIADLVYLSRSAVDKRITQLKKKGIIKKFTIEVSNDAADVYLLLIKSFNKNCGFIFKCLSSINECFTFESLYGEYDIIIRIHTNNFNRIYEIKKLLIEMSEVESVLIFPIIKNYGTQNNH